MKNIKGEISYCLTLKEAQKITGIFNTTIILYLQNKKKNNSKYIFEYGTKEEVMAELIKRKLIKENKGVRTEEQKQNISKGIIEKYISSEEFRIIKAFNLSDEFVGYFLNPREFAKFINTSNIPNITKCLKGKIKSTKGYKLFYGTKEETNKVLVEKGILKPNLVFKDFYDIIYTKKELQDFDRVKLNQIAEYVYNNLNEFIFPKEGYIEINECIKIGKESKRSFNKERKTFNNGMSLSSGVTFLKSIFKSFYKSSNKGSKSVYERVNLKENLLEVIKYRIGLNNTGEVWDLNFKAIVRGYSAIRGLVSFFKPSVALSIYENLYKGEINCTLDPCCGFGGRMMGFFLHNPKGKYIGCEPNSETFEELKKLKSKIEDYLGHNINCVLYNKKYEDFFLHDYKKHEFEIEFTFTSIPYFDLEKYSEDVINKDYISFSDWKKKFITPLLNTKNCWINLPKDLFERLEIPNLDIYYLENNVSKHLNKKQETKKEYIVKLN